MHQIGMFTLSTSLGIAWIHEIDYENRFIPPLSPNFTMFILLRAFAIFLSLLSQAPATSIIPPSNITSIHIRNNSPECQLHATFSYALSSHSTFHISYLPSLFDTIRKGLRKGGPNSLINRLSLKLDFDTAEYSIAVLDAMFRVYVNLIYFEEAQIEMAATWSGRADMASSLPYNYDQTV